MIPPIKTNACRPRVFMIHSRSPWFSTYSHLGETVTRQQGLDEGSSELMALPQPASRTTNYSFLCQHGRKVGSSSPLTSSGALTTLQGKWKLVSTRLCPQELCFSYRLCKLPAEFKDAKVWDEKCVRGRGEDFQTSRVSAPSYRQWIREALKSPTFIFTFLWGLS